MPLLQYPTLGNPRRGQDVDPISQVPITVSAAWGETITFRFLVTEGNLDAGGFAQVVITVTDADIADLTTFVIADQTFTVDNSIASNTATTVNFDQSDSLIHATNLQSAILSNPFFSNRVQVVISSNLGDHDVTITWLSRGLQFLTSSTAPAPYTLVTDLPGSDAEIVEGFALVYQVWMNDGGDIKPITDFRAVVPQLTAFQQYWDCEIEINDTLRPYLRLDFPYAAKNTAGIEANARKSFWIMYGWREIDRTGGLCSAIFHDFKQTDPEWVVYAAIQETDRRGMRMWFSGGDYPTPPMMGFMTKRPHFQVERNSIGWLYAILDLKERLDIATINYRYYVDRWNGSAWVNVSNSSIGTADGIYRVPAHPANLPTALPATTTLYRTEIRAVFDELETTYASQEWQITSCEAAMQLWFLGDLVAYEDFSFNKLWEEENVVDTDVALIPIRPFDNDSTANYGTRLSTGGRQVVNTRNFRRITGQIEALCDQESFTQYLESFLKSPLKYFRFVSESFIGGETPVIEELQRSVFIDPSSITTRSEGDMVEAEITFYFHKTLNVQI